MKSHLSHILPVWQACEILGEPTVHRIVSSLLNFRQNTSSNKPRSTLQLQDEIDALVQSLFYRHPNSAATTATDRSNGNVNTSTTTTTKGDPVPTQIAQSWKRWLTVRALALDKPTLLQFLVPSQVQPHTGAAGHMGLFDCWIYALQGHAASSQATYYGGATSQAAVWMPDVLILLAVCQQYRQHVELKANRSNSNNSSSNVTSVAAAVEEMNLESGSDTKEEKGGELASGATGTVASASTTAATAGNNKSVWTMAVLSFRIYDAYQKKGSVTRDTVHRFFTDVHGEDSYKESPCRSLLDAVFDDPEHATGWLHAACSEQQFCQRVVESARSGDGSHLLLDWISILGCAMVPAHEMPPSVAAYLETMDHQPRPLCDLYRLTEHRIYEIKRRFHSMVQSSSPVIHGDPMGSSDSLEGVGQPKHVISQAAFCDAVSASNEEMGTGGYLPNRLAQLVFRGGNRDDVELDSSGRQYWGLYHVMQFGCAAVRHNTVLPGDPDTPLLRFIFGMFQVASTNSEHHDGKRALTRDQVAQMLLRLLEHAKFRIGADSSAEVNEMRNAEEESPTGSPAVSLEETLVDIAPALLLGIFPPNLSRSEIQEKCSNNNGKSSVKVVALKQLVDYAFQNAERATMDFDEFCKWNKAAPSDGPKYRLGPLMTDLRMVAAVLFGIPPTLASMEVALIAEIQRRHKYRYPQTDVSRRGPRGTVWYIINDDWFKAWAILVKKVAGSDEDAVDGRDDSKSDSVRGLGRISNKGLLSDNGSLALRADIRWRHDYEILPPLAWSALQAWYDGGPPIHRTVVPYLPSGSASPHSTQQRIRTENEIELYPYFVTVFMCDVISRGEARPFQQYVPLSRVSPIGFMLVQLCKGLDVDPDLARLWVMGRSASGLGDEASADWILNLDSTIVDQRKRRNCGTDSSGITLLLEIKDTETGLWPRGLDGKEWSFHEKPAAVQDTSDPGDGVVGLYNMG